MAAEPLQQWQISQRGRAVADESWDRGGGSSVFESERESDHFQTTDRSSSEEESGESSDRERWHGGSPCPRALELVREDWFSKLVAGAILASTLIIAGETDYTDLWIWAPLNVICYLFFSVEITLRLMAYGWSFFTDSDMCWNIFDLSLVVGSWCSFFADMFVDNQQAKWSQYLTLLRVVRTLRFLRVLRLFKQCNQLMLLANGLMESVQMVFWIMVLMFMFMIIFAIILTDLIGNQSYKFEDPESIEEYWHGVMRCLITLFQFLTLDNWSEITREVTDTMPLMRIAFCFYIFMAAFAMLALLTGVIADHMGSISENQQKDEKAEKKKELEFFTDALRKNLQGSAMMQDRELHLSCEDLKNIMADEELMKLLEGYGVVVNDHEAGELFEFLDYNSDGLVNWSEFKAGLFRLREEQPSAWDVLRIRFAAERVVQSLEGGAGEAATLRKLDEVKGCMSSVESRLDRMEVWLRGFMVFAREPPGRHGSKGSILGSFIQPQA